MVSAVLFLGVLYSHGRQCKACGLNGWEGCKVAPSHQHHHHSIQEFYICRSRGLDFKIYVRPNSRVEASDLSDNRLDVLVYPVLQTTPLSKCFAS